MKRYLVTFYKKTDSKKEDEDPSYKNLGSVVVLYDKNSSIPLSALAFRRASLEQTEANVINIDELL